MHICKGDTTAAFELLGLAMTAHMYSVRLESDLGVTWREL